MGMQSAVVAILFTRVERSTGRVEPWLDLSPADRAGVSPKTGLALVALTPDGRYYAYTYVRSLYDLFLVEGLR